MAVRITVGTIAETATAFLALSAGLKAAGAAAPSATIETDAIVKPPVSLPRPAAERSLLSLERPRHIVGHPVPNHCGPIAMQATEPDGVKIAVAHYNENLQWLGDFSRNATIYSKNPDYDYGDVRQFRELYDLPNIALETHAYLFEILSHWDCLAEKTIFSQGDPSDSVDNYQGVEELVRRTQHSDDGMILYRNPGTFNEWWGVWHFGKWKEELESGEMRKSDMTPGDFYRWMFNGEEPPEQVEWTWSATFAVTRDTIRRRPRRFYKRLFDYLERLNHRKPEEGHYMERMWMSIFRSNAGAIQRRDRRHRLSLSPATDG